MYNRSTSAAAIQKYDCDATTGHSFSFSAKNSVAEPPGGGVGFQIWPSGCHGEPGKGGQSAAVPGLAGANTQTVDLKSGPAKLKKWCKERTFAPPPVTGHREPWATHCAAVGRCWGAWLIMSPSCTRSLRGTCSLSICAAPRATQP